VNANHGAGTPGFAAPAALAAGGLLIGHYLLHLGYGLATGGVLFGATASPAWYADVVAFMGSHVGGGAALLGLAAGLRGRRAIWWAGAPGALLAAVGGAVGLTGMGIGLLRPHALNGAMQAGLGPLSVLTLFLSAILLGAVHLGAGRLPRPAAACILLYGLVTLPLGMALMPLEKAVPSYLVMELHFVVSGALWIMAGLILLRRRHADARGAGEHRTAAVVAT